MNEPRCQSDVSGHTIQSWITEMAVHVKSIDGNHLLDATLEGFYGLLPPPSRSSMNLPRHDKMGTDFIANNQVPGVNVEEIGKAQRTQSRRPSVSLYIYGVQVTMGNNPNKQGKIKSILINKEAYKLHMYFR